MPGGGNARVESAGLAAGREQHEIDLTTVRAEDVLSRVRRSVRDHDDLDSICRVVSRQQVVDSRSQHLRFVPDGDDDRERRSDRRPMDGPGRQSCPRRRGVRDSRGRRTPRRRPRSRKRPPSLLRSYSPSGEFFGKPHKSRPSPASSLRTRPEKDLFQPLPAAARPRAAGRGCHWPQPRCPFSRWGRGARRPPRPARPAHARRLGSCHAPGRNRQPLAAGCRARPLVDGEEGPERRGPTP